MKVTIVPVDNIVIIDGVALSGLDLSSLTDGIHAIQWDGSSGHIEYIDDRINTNISDISFCDAIVAEHSTKLYELEHPVYTLEELRERMENAIKGERDKRKNGGFKVEVSPGVTKWFHSDPESRVQQLGLFMAGATVPPIPWKTMDKSFVPMSQAIAQAIFNQAFILDGAVFANAERHIQTMLTSADPANYDYSTGWPEHYAV